jgi:type IV pilus assembly protein PilC
MPFYEYKAKNSRGKTVAGTIETGSETAVLEYLAKNQMMPLSIEKSQKKKDIFSKLTFLNKVSTKDLVLFSRQLSVMKSANLTLVESLRILEKQTEHPRMKVVVSEVADEVDGGSRLSSAMANYPQVFNNFFVSVIKSGETSGKLDEVLNYLADQQEKDYDLMSKIKGAMIYPAFVIFGLFAVGIIMMVFVVPQLTGMLTETGQELPGATKVLIALSSFTKDFWWAGLIFLIGAFFATKRYSQTKRGGMVIDFIKIKLPIFGILFKKIFIVRFTRSMTVLLTSGVSLVEALKVSKDVIGNKVYENLIAQTIKEVQDGNTISSIFIEDKEVPFMLSQMMAVGEKTGKLDKVLEKMTHFYSREIDNTVTNLVSLIEPLIMVVLGVAVGFMVSAIIMPMYNMTAGM